MAAAIASAQQFPRPIRPLPDPLALYLRAGRTDHKPRIEFAATSEAAFHGGPRARAMLGCRNPNCCPRGVIDMLENPARHFLFQRTSQISELSRIPQQVRPQRFLDLHVRPATDQALAFANMKWETKEMADAASRHRKRLDLMRVSLGKRVAAAPPTSFAALPRTRVAREGAR